MHLYEVITTTGITLSIFGESYDEAAALFTAWHLEHGDQPLPDFEVKQRNPRWPGLNTGHLLSALEQGLSGVGRYDPDNGWWIGSPFDKQED